MNYCDNCGAANDALETHCRRCGAELAQSADAAAAVAVAPGTASAESAGAAHTAELGGHLELPDWLKRAATEPVTANQPSDSPAAEPHLPPPGFYIPPQQPAEIEAVAESDVPAPQPLHSIPAQDLAASMPEWLKPQLTAKADIEPLAASLSASSDPSSFISETDLPEWIRQIAAADAAKLAEQARQEHAPIPVEPAAPGRSVIPGEQSPSAPAANPWLARRESGAASQAWGHPNRSGTAAQVKEEAAPQPVEEPTVAAGKMERTRPPLSLPLFGKLAGASNDPSRSPLRLALLAAGIVILLIVLAGMLM
jgi:hypothetical protein